MRLQSHPFLVLMSFLAICAVAHANDRSIATCNSNGSAGIDIQVYGGNSINGEGAPHYKMYLWSGAAARFQSKGFVTNDSESVPAGTLLVSGIAPMFETGGKFASIRFVVPMNPPQKQSNGHVVVAKEVNYDITIDPVAKTVNLNGQLFNNLSAGNPLQETAASQNWFFHDCWIDTSAF